MWPWAALLLVLGILTMHGLVSTQHATHGGPGSTSTAADAMTAPMPVAETEHAAARAGLGPTGGLDLRDVVVAAVGLCLAVLLGSLLLHRTGRGWFRTQLSRPVVTPPIRTSPPARGPPRLLLAQLCVLRT